MSGIGVAVFKGPNKGMVKRLPNYADSDRRCNILVDEAIEKSIEEQW